MKVQLNWTYSLSLELTKDERWLLMAIEEAIKNKANENADDLVEQLNKSFNIDTVIEVSNLFTPETNKENVCK